MKDLLVTKFESNEGKHTSVQLQVNCQLQNYKKKVLSFGGCSLFGVSLNLEGVLIQYLLRWLAPWFLTQILQGMAPILLSNSLYGNSQARKQRDKQ